MPPDDRPKHWQLRIISATTAVVLLVGGWLATLLGGSWRDYGELAFGYGIGVAVATGFLWFGHNPLEQWRNRGRRR